MSEVGLGFRPERASKLFKSKVPCGCVVQRRGDTDDDAPEARGLPGHGGVKTFRGSGFWFRAQRTQIRVLYAYVYIYKHIHKLMLPLAIIIVVTAGPIML